MFGTINGSSENWLVNKIFEEQLLIFSKDYLKGDMVDIGCGTKPYQQILAPYVDKHIGLDHKDSFHDSSNVDLFGTAYEIPVEAERFDSAICSAVLEHLEEPLDAIIECHRVLKKGGVAIYSIPFIWHIHEEPRDFFRYSKYGIKYLFEKANFEIIELKPLSGFWVTFGQAWVYYIYQFNRGPLRWFKIISGIGFLIQRFIYLINKVDRSDKWTWMYIVAAKKV
ncbi:MAG: SAM-dependent methyltransferase [Ulvibacter sp.]|jgi:SAM-dependent methyltransferase